ncbi:hypothetical protein HYPSUDRAFT_568982 [Hypholoma sublateritium FD-334 SS-4]|uniref:Uncharacterized protein n=1 Tax=Hypholoma sublateritium (strain FD-334 SS-4) TaxID=945553 RepID=A0A0D2P4U3_HYPSF|nr:hypothetical protein HYPSUDRAFT_568982 [Hypholoma sublateritium FD-334 SS-4]
MTGLSRYWDGCGPIQTRHDSECGRAAVQSAYRCCGVACGTTQIRCELRCVGATWDQTPPVICASVLVHMRIGAGFIRMVYNGVSGATDPKRLGIHSGCGHGAHVCTLRATRERYRQAASGGDQSGVRDALVRWSDVVSRENGS